MNRQPDAQDMSWQVAASLEAFIVAWTVRDGVRRELVAEVRTRLYRDGSWHLSAYDPQDPLHGATLAGESDGPPTLDQFVALLIAGSRPY
jgi:hypothetical protein